MNNPQQSLKANWKTLFALAKKIGGTEIGKKLAQKWTGKIALTVAGITTIPVPANALQFNATYSSPVSLAQAESINNAMNSWAEAFYDRATVNIDFSFSNTLPTGVLGGAKPGMIKVNYKDYLTALGADISSNDDIVAVQSKLVAPNDQDLFNKYIAAEIDTKDFKVEDTKTINVLLDQTFNPAGSSGTTNIGFLDNNDNRNNQKIWLTRANAKALDLIQHNNQELDATIVLNSTINWDMNPNDGISANAYDFNTVVRHEIAHALGFVSGIDAVEFLRMTTTTSLTDDSLSF